MSEELKPSAEAERRMRLEDLTKNLPPLPDIPWVWTDEETEMLRAACAKRFGESVRTETLFAIAATGIRIYMSRATITTDNTKAAAELTIKLRDANALIDTLVEASEGMIEYSMMREDYQDDPKVGVPLKEAMLKALVEAKKVRGE